ncbi:MarR family winged helix-turn-helix transcriptional regulator [Chryseobacterium sp. JV558]|uniref:MarR family winged helix-turn-helix transcriptional regulator n=1 Tax=Chryseobacterium sp. JV558 TaxID=2663236 RepID=UPI00299E011A|nr:MarR family transcriptional regulator [Chryseobacterium sp. JV558]MDW9381473.1 MarR family transcriptional regulator [Chryseobacterium sp. JV558]
MNKNTVHHFREASRSYSDASIFMHEAIARKAGLSNADHKYLGLILKYESITAGEISKLTGLTTGAVTGLIDRLEKKDLLKRQFIREDRRKVIIIPNVENSMKLLGPIFDELQQKTLTLIATFSQKEIESIERYFREATILMKETADHLNNP